MAVTINGTNGIETNTDTGKVKVGVDDDLQIYHNGTDSIISNTTGDFNVTTTGAQRFNVTGDFVVNVKAGTEDGLKVKTDGAVELYADNVKKLQTNSSFGTILSNTTDDANYTNVLTLARRGYEISGYGVNFKVKGGSSSGQNGLKMQVSQGSGGYSDKFTFDNDGLKFGSDTAAANALDDYEEGSWTPSLTSNPTLSENYGRYTKIGRMVFVTFQFTFGNDGTASHMYINNLPFTSLNENPNAGSVAWDYRTNNTIVAHVSKGTQRVYFYNNIGGALEGNDTEIEGKEHRGTVIYTAA